MSNLYEHPDITAALLTGYPRGMRPDWVKSCPWCDDDLGDAAYDIGGEKVCEECVKEYIRDRLEENPEEVAAMFGIVKERL